MSANIHRLDTIRPAAPASCSGVTAPGARKANPLVAAMGRLRDRVVRARLRRAAFADLSRLSDRVLADIGIRREEIPEVVEGMLRREFDSRS